MDANEFYQVAVRKKLYRTFEELQVDLDTWLLRSDLERTNQGQTTSEGILSGAYRIGERKRLL
jgi:hypothetical protein